VESITIQTKLFESIRKIAQHEKTSIEVLVNTWLARQLALVREQHIKEESARFAEQHGVLRERYMGQYVAMRDGEIVDHDTDVSVLYLRIKEQHGDAPILIAPVTEHPIPVYEMRSPRLARPADE
jgi:hypothetical protein